VPRGSGVVVTVQISIPPGERDRGFRINLRRSKGPHQPIFDSPSTRRRGRSRPERAQMSTFVAVGLVDHSIKALLLAGSSS